MRFFRRRAGRWSRVRDHLGRWWNWKSALASGLLRAPVFFAVNLPIGWAAAVAAFQTEFLYRLIASGFYGALTEVFARARSAQASAAALIVLPAIAHSAEYFVHSRAGTPALGRSIAASVVVSVASTGFSVFVMRRGLFLARASQPFSADVRQLAQMIRSSVATWFAPCT